MHMKRWVMALTGILFFLFFTAPVTWSQGKVDINTATVQQLTRIKGVGVKTAEKIVEYREANGLFKNPEDITKIPGIGLKVIENNKDLIVVSP
jgi:competence protein ComEA